MNYSLIHETVYSVLSGIISFGSSTIQRPRNLNERAASSKWVAAGVAPVVGGMTGALARVEF